MPAPTNASRRIVVRWIPPSLGSTQHARMEPVFISRTLTPRTWRPLFFRLLTCWTAGWTGAAIARSIFADGYGWRKEAYLALCEALLTHDPARGADLWRALSVMLTTRYIGAVGVDELLHLVFRVPDSVPVAELRAELLD